MGRKNRKGRRAKHNPQRFYREKRQGERDGGNPDADFDRAGADAWSARVRRRRRRRSGAADAVESMMELALRHDHRELVREQPPREPGPLWLIDAADVKSLPHPSGRNPNDPPRNAVGAAPGVTWPQEAPTLLREIGVSLVPV